MGRLILILLVVGLVAWLFIALYESYVMKHKDEKQLRYRVKFHDGMWYVQYQLPVSKRWKNNTRIINDHILVDDKYEYRQTAEEALKMKSNNGLKNTIF